MAEHQESYEFSAVKTKDILAERERNWEGFTQFLTWSILVTALVLIALLVFVV